MGGEVLAWAPGEVLGVSGPGEVEGGFVGSRTEVAEGGRCIRGVASREVAHASRGGAWGLGDPLAIRSVAPGEASPLAAAQGVACRVEGEVVAGLLPPVALGGAGPFQAFHDGPASEAFLDASLQEGTGVDVEGVPHQEHLQ